MKPVEAILTLSCDAQLEAVRRIASNIGYDIVPEQNYDPGEPIRIAYTNWRGEPTSPVIVPSRIFWGSNEWHPEPCWLVEAFDIGKQAVRTFDVRKIAWWYAHRDTAAEGGAS